MKKTILILLAVAMLLSLSACGKDKNATLADQIFIAEEPLTEPEAEPEPEPEPEPEDPGIIVALAAAPEELLSGSFAQNLYLPLLSCADGAYHSHVIDYVGTGANGWKMTVKEGLSDFNGNAFTAEDLKALLEGRSELKDLTLTEDGAVTFTLVSDEINLLEKILSETYAVTETAASAGSDIPAGFGPYLVSETRENELILKPNASCPADDCACTRATAEKFTVRCSVSPEEQAALLASGEIDVAWDLASAAEGCSLFRFFTGDCVFLVLDPNASLEESEDPDVVYSLAPVLSLSDRSALCGDGYVPADTLFAPGFIGSEPAREFDPAFSGTLPPSLTLGYAPEDEALANALKSQLEAKDLKITLAKTDDVFAPGQEHHLAIVHASGLSANEVLAGLFAGDPETGSTRWGLANADVVEAAALMATVYGRSDANLRLFLDYITAEPCVTGIGAQVRLSGLREGLNASCSASGLLLGTIE